jgi:hypothetical protein
MDDCLIGNERAISAAQLVQYLTLVKQTLAQTQEVAAHSEQYGRRKTLQVRQQAFLDGVEIIFQQYNGCELLVDDLIENQVHQVRRDFAIVAIPDCSVIRDGFRKRVACRFLPADRYQALFADEYVDLIDTQRMVLILERVHQNKGITRIVGHFRRLI